MDYLSEDFLGLGNTKPIRNCLRFALESCDNERFGIFVHKDSDYDYEFIPIDNLDKSNPNHFNINNKLFYNYYKQSKVISLFHTHIIDSPEPSPIDIALSQSLNLPTYILSCSSKKSSLYYPPVHNRAELYSRIFIPFFQDCITFVKDFLYLKFNINLVELFKNWARRSKDSNSYLINELEKHFNEVKKTELKYGDVVIFKPSMTNLFHAGIIDEKLMLSHHPMGYQPTSELFTPQLLNKVYKVYRSKVL